jgi:hypothetical protein
MDEHNINVVRLETSQRLIDREFDHFGRPCLGVTALLRCAALGYQIVLGTTMSDQLTNCFLGFSIDFGGIDEVDPLIQECVHHLVDHGAIRLQMTKWRTAKAQYGHF